MDWSRCLTVATGPAVVRQIAGFLREASQKRNAMMAQRIDDSLGDDEAGLLIIGQDHAVQFPPDIQVFYVSPPTLDEIARLLLARGEGRERTGIAAATLSCDPVLPDGAFSASRTSAACLVD